MAKAMRYEAPGLVIADVEQNKFMKIKKYIVPVRSHVSAEMIVHATSKNEAYSIASKDIEESLKKQLAAAVPRDDIKNLTGYTEAMKSSIEICTN